ncbi:M48 family metallopeptidase [Hahella ganghwensis]|uniref:M48 family metallopeptidase n=1 Tax=Hahella ganghwensis TaxID=286420 RepID=UPI0003A8060E|nr:M48 family metallopeptidase [Hahella ganghwensis]
MVCVLLTACSGSQIKPITDPGYQPGKEDARLRITADRLSKRIEDSRHYYHDPEVQDYLNRIARRLVGSLELGDIKLNIQVIENPNYNAFVLANGHIYIHTGLLSLIDSEAELATILAHEIGHVVHRDAARAADQRKSAANLYAGFSALPLINIFGGLHMAGSISGYSRDLERNADHYAAERLNQAGYNLAEGSGIFRKLSEATEGITENDTPYFFSTHPRMKERVDSFGQLEFGNNSNQQKQAPIESTPNIIFRDMAWSTLANYIELGNTAQAEHLLPRLKEYESNNAVLRYYEAKIAQLKGEDEEYRSLLNQALALEDQPDIRRELGLLSFKNRDWANAREHLTQYLKQAPEAKDRMFIEAYLREIKEHKDTEQ